MVDGTLNADFERRSYWSATMAAPPDRSGRSLPDTAEVVVIGGGDVGITAPREPAHMPFVGEWFRLQDRLAALGRAG